MYIIGLVGRNNFNKIEINKYIIDRLSLYNDIEVIGILPDANFDKILSICNGFIVPGGDGWNNIDEKIIEYAIKKDKPLLAICLGFQVLSSMDTNNRNKLDMSIIVNDKHYGKRHTYAHNNLILKNTKLFNIINKDIISVNSNHHYGMANNFKTLKVAAISDDNIVEAVEVCNKKFIIGLQWHPEYIDDEISNKIFNFFINTIINQQKQ